MSVSIYIYILLIYVFVYVYGVSVMFPIYTFLNHLRCLGCSMGLLGGGVLGVIVQSFLWLVVSTPVKNMKVSWDDYSHILYGK